jgi:ribosomal protein S18 acetylase RimI-like enzyme
MNASPGAARPGHDLRSMTSVRQATTPADIAAARALFVEYAAWLNVDLCFQGFDEELAALPGAYAPPQGRLLLAGGTGGAVGCIALRPLEANPGHGGDTAAAPPVTGEVKRLYVRPECRDGGWGRKLAEALLAEARTIGYRELKLDTLEWMTAARRLYASLGFAECSPYYRNPLPGVVYMARTL